MNRRWLLGCAAAAVLLAAIDTYVIVLALPAIMAGVGIGVDQLQAATPIVSGFLLGYVVVMPLLGRLSDTYGRRPLLLLCLGVFAAGSLVTASAHDLGSAVAGRALQGLGGGGLVPVTLALVADLWPVERRGIPLGLIGGVQELGSVLGPLYGGLILTVASWQTIFWVNVPLAAALGGGLAIAGRREHSRLHGARSDHQPPQLDPLAAGLAGIALVSGGLAIAAPEPLRDSDIVGLLYTAVGGATWLTPLTIVAVVAAAGCLATLMPRRRHRLRELGQAADWPAAALLGVVLATVVISFSSVDPTAAVIAPSALWLLPLGGICAVLLVIRERHARTPLVAAGALTDRGAIGALVCNLAIGAALIAALLDIPVLARATVFPDSQLGAALVLLRLLIGIPIGAVLGGWLCQRWGNRVTAGTGMAIAAFGFALMTRWTATTLADPLGPSWLHPSDPVLFACGLGFGLAIAPVNASVLASVAARMHGLASALAVVARMIGMLVGISVLTAVGLHAYYIAAGALPQPQALCPRSPLQCPAYRTEVTGAIVTELHTVFLGAALCAAVAAILAGLLLRDREARPEARPMVSAG